LLTRGECCADPRARAYTEWFNNSPENKRDDYYVMKCLEDNPNTHTLPAQLSISNLKRAQGRNYPTITTQRSTKHETLTCFDVADFAYTMERYPHVHARKHFNANFLFVTHACLPCSAINNAYKENRNIRLIRLEANSAFIHMKHFMRLFDIRPKTNATSAR